MLAFAGLPNAAAIPAPNTLWARSAGAGTDAYGVTVDAAGNVYVTGLCSGTGTFGPNSSGGTVSVTSAGGYDLFVAKYNSAGTVQWVRLAGAPGSSSVGYGVAVNAAGEVYVTGLFYGTITSGSTTLASVGSSDAVVAKYDGAGNPLWAVSAGGLYGDQGEGITVDASGDVLVTGQFQVTASFGGGGTTLNNGLNAAGFVARYTSAGAFVWAKQFGNLPVMYHNVVTDPAGNIYLAGSFSATSVFGTTTLNTTGGADPDIVIAKCDALGNVLWVKQVGSSGFDYAVGIARHQASGDIYVMGGFSGTVTFGTTTLTATGPSGYDLYVAKYTSVGSFVWVQKVSGLITSEQRNTITVDSAGAAYIIGENGANVFMQKYDAAGALVWSRADGSGQTDLGNAVAVSCEGQACVTGWAGDTFSFDSQGVTKGMFLAKMDFDQNGPVSSCSNLCVPPVITTQPASVTANDCTSATFSVAAGGTGPLTCSWCANSSLIISATGPSYTINPVSLADDGTMITVVISNSCGSATSVVAVLHVLADTTPPTVVSAVADCAAGTVTVNFSEPMLGSTGTGALDIWNYMIDFSSFNIVNAVFGSGPQQVVLSMDSGTPLASGVTHTLDVFGLTDLCGNPLVSSGMLDFLCPGNGDTNCVTCPTNKTVECGSQWSFDLPSINCSNFTTTFIQLGTVTNGPCPITITRMWAYTNALGQTNTCSQTMTLHDFTPPVFNGGSGGGANLIPNPSFEIQTACPDNLSEIHYAPPWITPTAGTSDLFDTCSTSFMNSVPANFFGTQAPYSGHAYAGGYAYTAHIPEYREYIQAPLIAPMVAGQTYTISFYVALGGTSDFAVDCLGAHLSVGPISSTSQGPLPVTPQIRNLASSFITTSLGWVLIQGSYIAAGGEDHITIGNFYDDASTPRITHVGGGYGISYFFVDGPSVSLPGGCLPDKTVECGTPWTFDLPTVSDDCCGTNITLTYTDSTNGTCPMRITRTWTATDCCTNTATCSQTVTVLNNSSAGSCGPLHIQLDGVPRPGSVILTWADTGQLQSSPTLGNPVWANVAGSSPLTIPAPPMPSGSPSNPSAGKRFFRTVSANGACSPNIVGYVNLSLTAGYTLIANPLNGTNNLLDTLLPLDMAGDGAVITRFNPATQSFSTPETFYFGLGWLDDIGNPDTAPMNPGDGFHITLPQPLVVTFVGEAAQGNLVNPLLVGLSYQSSIVPVAGQVGDVPYLNVPAGNGDEIFIFDPATQSYKLVYTFSTGTGWSSANSDDPGSLGPYIPAGTGFIYKNVGAARLWTNNFVLRDCHPPSCIVCPADKTVDCGTAWTFDKPSGTNCCCPDITLAILSTTTNSGCPTVITRIWQATDCCSNSIICSQTITIIDHSPPVFGGSGSGANLVPNPSFEIHSQCPDDFSQTVCDAPWFTPTQGSSDLFDSCSTSANVDVPNNYFGSLAPHSGNAYAGGYAYASFVADYREYVEVQLLSPLVAGQTYTVSLYAALADNSGYAADTIGAHLSVGPLTGPSVYPLPAPPQVRNPVSSFITANLGWVLVQGSYTAAGGENHITIGNFYDDANTPRITTSGANVNVSYYFVDDVSVNLQGGGCPQDKTVDCGTQWTFDTPTISDACCGTNITPPTPTPRTAAAARSSSPAPGPPPTAAPTARRAARASRSSTTHRRCSAVLLASGQTWFRILVLRFTRVALAGWSKSIWLRLGSCPPTALATTFTLVPRPQLLACQSTPLAIKPHMAVRLTLESSPLLRIVRLAIANTLKSPC